MSTSQTKRERRNGLKDSKTFRSHLTDDDDDCVATVQQLSLSHKPEARSSCSGVEKEVQILRNPNTRDRRVVCQPQFLPPSSAVVSVLISTSGLTPRLEIADLDNAKSVFSQKTSC